MTPRKTLTGALLSLTACLAITACATPSVVKSAKGNLQVQSQQIILASVRQQGDQLVVAGRLYSPLHSVNRLTTRRSGKAMSIRMTQALLRDGGRSDFQTVVAIPPGIDHVTIGQDNQVIWSRGGGVSSGITDRKLQTDRAATDFDKRLNDFLRAFD